MTANAGSGGSIFATDEAAGAVHHPITKLEWGPDGTFNLVDDATGKRIPVKVGEALPAGDSNIGNVDIVTVPAPLNVIGTGTEAAAMRVTIATDSTGVLSVDDNGGSLTVDGTVAVSGTVTVAAHAVTNAGTFAVQDSEKVTDNAGFTDGTTKVAPAGFVFDETAGTALTENDAAAARIDSKRAQVCTIEDETTRGRRATVTAANALKVDNSGVTQPASQSGTWTVQPGNTANTTPWLASIHDGTTKATVRDLAANDALNVAIVDGSGGQITSFGGGTEYTEDAVAAADPVGKATILIRNDTPTITAVDLDNVAQRGTKYGAGYVQVVSSSGSFIDSFGGSGGTAQADESAFTEGTTNMTPIGGVLNDTITSDPTEDQAAAVRITAKRALHANLRKVDGTEIASGAGTEANALRVTLANDSTGLVSIDDNGGSLTVDGTVAVSGTVTVDSELPAAAALADAAANPTVPSVGALGLIFNGTTWDRVRGDTTNGLDVDVTRLPPLVAGTANIGDVDVLTLPALPAGTNNIGDVDVLSVVPGTGASNLGKAEDAAHTTADVGVYALAVHDTSPAAHSGLDGDYESLHVNDEGGLWTTPTPSANGGLSIFRSLDIDESEEEVKATAGTIYGGLITNTATTTRWIKFYNATAANVTVGTTTPVITWGIPGNATDDIAAIMGCGAMGIAFSTAICVAATTGFADADTGAPGANDVIINLFYK